MAKVSKYSAASPVIDWGGEYVPVLSNGILEPQSIGIQRNQDALDLVVVDVAYTGEVIEPALQRMVIEGGPGGITWVLFLHDVEHAVVAVAFFGVSQPGIEIQGRVEHEGAAVGDGHGFVGGSLAERLDGGGVELHEVVSSLVELRQCNGLPVDRESAIVEAHRQLQGCVKDALERQVVARDELRAEVGDLLEDEVSRIREGSPPLFQDADVLVRCWSRSKPQLLGHLRSVTIGLVNGIGRGRSVFVHGIGDATVEWNGKCAVNVRVLKDDARAAVGGHDELHALVVPPVGAVTEPAVPCPFLRGFWASIIKADDECGRLDCEEILSVLWID